MDKTKEGPRYDRIAQQGYIWLDAEKKRLGDKKNEENKKAEYRARRKLAIVLDEERER
jgi:hypothetical protein